MAYSKVNLRSNSDKASPFLRPFWIGNPSDRFLPIWTLLLVMFTHILITITNLIGMPSLVRIFYNAFLLTDSLAFSYSVNIWCTVLLSSHLFSSIWWTQNMWSVVDILCQNPYWWFPIILSVYEVTFETRIWNKTLYVVGNSDFTLQL